MMTTTTIQRMYVYTYGSLFFFFFFFALLERPLIIRYPLEQTDSSALFVHGYKYALDDQPSWPHELIKPLV